MKKILSIFALLLTIVIGAKAAKPSISGITLPDAPTTALDLSSQTDFTPDADGWIVFSPKAESVNNKAYWANNATNGNSRTWSKPSGAVAPFVGGSSKSVFALQTGRVHALTFTGAETFSVLGKSGGTGRYVHVALYTFDGNNFGLVDDKSDNSNSDKELLFEDLTSSTTYVAYFYGSATSNSDLFEVALKAGSTAEVTGVTLDGVKIGGSTATETTDYTISGTNITLTGSYSIAPEVSLTEKTTYDEGDPTTKDIAVTLTKGEAYFTGSAKIGAGTDYETEYTVQVPVSTAATLEASETALSVTSVKVGTGTATFTLTGANLAGESVSVAFASAVEGLTVSPASIEIASGAVNQEVTVSYQSNEDVDAAVVNLVVSTTGVSDITIPVTYSSTAPVIYSQVDVTEAATWNWANYGTNEIKLTDETTPSKSTEFLLANIENYGYNAPASTFGNAQQLLMTTEYVVREGKYWQGGSIKFNTTVPGKITVVYSNTGNRDDEAQRRFLNVNGINYGVGTMTSKSTTTTTVSVAAGEVAITGKFGPSVEDQTGQYLRINSITFTPTTTETVTIPTEGVATYVTKSALDFSTVNGTIKAYAVTNVGATSATTAEVGQVPAGTPLLIKGAAGEYDVEIVESADDIENLLKVSDGTIVGGDDIYAYSKTALKFKKVAATVKIPAGKCYLQANAGDAIDIDFEGEATAITNVNGNANSAAPVKVLTAKGVQIGKFNVAGQQVK